MAVLLEGNGDFTLLKWCEKRIAQMLDIIF